LKILIIGLNYFPQRNTLVMYCTEVRPRNIREQDVMNDITQLGGNASMIGQNVKLLLRRPEF
jgi:hypothetical protein